MTKKATLFWRYFGLTLVFAETAIYFLLVEYPFSWQFIRLAFMFANILVIAYLVQVKLKVEKHNAEVDAVIAANEAKLQPENANQPEESTSQNGYELAGGAI